jgi:hypothetical protein
MSEFIGPPKKLFKSYTMPKAKTATEIAKDLGKGANVQAGKLLTALGSPFKTTKKLLSKAKAKFTGAAKRVKSISRGDLGKASKPLVGKSAKAGLGKQNKLIAQLKKTPTKARLASKALRVAKFARAATPIGLATVAVTSIKKRDPEAVKREREFFKGKKYKDYGFESMLNYKKGGLKMATEKLKAKGYRYGTMAKGNVKEGIKKSKEQAIKLEDFRKMAIQKIRGAQVGPMEEKRISNFFPSMKDSVDVRKQKMDKVKQMISKFNKGKMANLKKIPEGPKGEGLRKLKAARPDVTRKMGFAKKGKVMKAMAGKSVRGYGAARTSGMGLQDEQMIPGKSMDYYKDLM